jgi:hypothetical protein
MDVEIACLFRIRPLHAASPETVYLHGGGVGHDAYGK